VLQVTERVSLVVTGLHNPNVREIEVLYEIRDSRDPHGDRVKAFKPLDPKAPAYTLNGQERGEGEPEPPSRRETSKLAQEVHQAELDRLKRIRDQHGEHLKELASHPRDVRWPITKTIERFDRRIKELERLLPASKREQRRNAA
jgi:hypothetical protein